MFITYSMRTYEYGTCPSGVQVEAVWCCHRASGFVCLYVYTVCISMFLTLALYKKITSLAGLNKERCNVPGECQTVTQKLHNLTSENCGLLGKGGHHQTSTSNGVYWPLKSNQTLTIALSGENYRINQFYNSDWLSVWFYFLQIPHSTEWTDSDALIPPGASAARIRSSTINTRLVYFSWNTWCVTQSRSNVCVSIIRMNVFLTAKTEP